jgi:putative PIN family toxin of toxin-antitoxin system
MRVVLDTNVLVSAFVYGGNPRRIVELVVSGEVEMSISEPLVQELQDVLLREQFDLNPQLVRTALAELSAIAQSIVPQKHHTLIKEDPSDNLVLDCAVEAGAEYIVTGDRHLLRLKKCGKVRIVNPQQFVSAYRGA